MSESAPFDLFQWLPSDVQLEFASRARLQHFRQGELIYSQDDDAATMFRLVSGAVRLSVVRSDGRELLYLLFGPGDCFGVSGLIDGEPLPQTAEAAEDCQALVLGKPGFDTIRRNFRSFDDALLKLVTKHMRLLSGLFADAHLEDFSARVASRIVAAAHGFGVATPAGMEVTVGLSQSELGLMLGAARQTVNRAVQEFQKEGILTVRQGHIIVHSLAALEARASATRVAQLL